MSRPIVALLTDFGTRDHYVGAVKGAVLAVCPEAEVVDVTHEVTPHDVAEGAFALGAAYRAFPGRTVFVGVVDPGVGTARRGLVVEAGGYRLVGPDNGLLTFVLADNPAASIREIANTGLFRQEVAPTFHGRDIFAPVAGHLARGAPLDLIGPPASGPVLLEIPRVVPRGDGEWEAVVLHVDRFGNLTTNMTRRDLERILAEPGGGTGITVLVEGAVLPLVRTYADVPQGEPCALVGSSDRLEVAVNCGSATRLLGASRGAPVRVRRT
jgi:S-adenosyl-L-methionine hydrolase (adenosine-forming)